MTLGVADRNTHTARARLGRGVGGLALADRELAAEVSAQQADKAFSVQADDDLHFDE